MKKLASARYTLNIKHEENEPEKVYTKKEKFDNFWHYHKNIIFAVIAAIILIVFFMVDVLSKVEPDYNIALLNHSALPNEALELLQAELTPYAQDLNGDGSVEVYINQYTIAPPTSEESTAQTSEQTQTASTVDPNTQMANVTRIMADLQLGTSMIFITDDVESFQQQYGMFAYNDGTTPNSEQINFDELGVKWQDSSVLSNINSEFTDFMQNSHDAQTVFGNYTVVLRIFEDTSLQGDEQLEQYYHANVDLFNTLVA